MNRKLLSSDDRRKLEYAEKSIAFFVKERKEINRKLEKESNTVNRLKQKARVLYMEKLMGKGK
jgi:hypothetical protein